MKFILSVLMVFNVVFSVSAAVNNKEAYRLSMENDAQFIEAVGALFNALANLQRTIVQDLKWENNNSEYKKIKQSILEFKKSRNHLKVAIDNSDLLLSKISEEKKKSFSKQLNTFKLKIGDLDNRLVKIIETLEQNKFPDRKYIHETIKLSLAGVGFGMEVSKSKADPAKSN